MGNKLLVQLVLKYTAIVNVIEPSDLKGNGRYTWNTENQPTINRYDNIRHHLEAGATEIDYAHWMLRTA